MSIKGDTKETYNYVIIGAGTAGLTAGIYAVRHGFSALIIEKEAIPGPKPRGETIHHYPFLDEILGSGFIQSISKHNTAERLFHSPKNRYQSPIKASSTSYIFEWKDFIDQFVKIIGELKIEIRCNSEVFGTIEEDNICVGVRYKDKNNDTKEVYGDVILACDGYDSKIGNIYDIDYSKVNNPIVKCLVKNANIEIKNNSALELFLLAKGELDYAKDFPPCALFMFPRGGGEIEIGVMLFMSVANLIDGVKIPTEDRIMYVWNKVKESYPGFSVFLKGASIEYEELTGITSSGFIKNYIPIPGIVLIGDSAGFIESSGSSGIYSSMAMAKEWIELTSKEIKDNNQDIWSLEKINSYKKQFRKSEIYKHIIKVYKMFLGFLRTMFKTMGTAEEINKNWEKIAAILQKAKSST